MSDSQQPRSDPDRAREPTTARPDMSDSQQPRSDPDRARERPTAGPQHGGSTVRSGRVTAASTLLCLCLSALLVSDKIVEIADRLPIGSDRDRWLAVAEATDRVSNLLSFNRPYDLLREARGAGDDAGMRIDSIGDLEDVLSLDPGSGIGAGDAQMPDRPALSPDSVPNGSAALDGASVDAQAKAGPATGSEVAGSGLGGDGTAGSSPPSDAGTITGVTPNDATTSTDNSASATPQAPQAPQAPQSADTVSDAANSAVSSNESPGGASSEDGSGSSQPFSGSEPEEAYIRSHPVSVYVPLRTYVAGDSQAFHLGHSLQAGRLNDILDITLDQRHSTGLARPGYFNWPVHLYFVALGADPEIMIMTLGSNDWQNMTSEEDELLPRGSDEWQAEWARRLGVMMDVMRAPHRRFIWVGLPPARSSQTHEGFATMNELAAQVIAERADFASMIDIWELFGGDEPYRESIPAPHDPGGQPVKVRQKDGIHLNRRGADWTAELVDAEIERIIAEIAPLSPGQQ